MGTSVFLNSVMKLFLLLSALIVVVMCRSQKPIHHRHHHGSLGLIMAGGGIYNPPSPTIYQTSVEMFFPETNTSCDLPPLPTGRAGLTLDVVQDVVVACGGDPTLQSCMMLVDGEWIEFYTTREIRRGFTSWVTPRGLRLLGAFIAPPSNFSETTELVPVRPWDEGGYSWNLAHPSARFCTIPVGEELVMTGGVDHYNHVARYSMEGESTAMPDMIQGRMGHACSCYSTGEKQMLIVAGGSGSSHQLISSTEVMALDGSGWREVGELMRPMGGLKNAKIGNNVYLSGGWSGDAYHDKIVVFNQDTEEWEEVGKMGEARINHGMTAAPSTLCKV